MDNRNKIKKSSSLHHLPTDSICLDHHKKSKKISSRRTSICDLTYTLNLQIQQLEQTNQNLKRQNKELKQRITFYERTQNQRNPKRESKVYQQTIRNIVNNKLSNQTKCSSRIMTQCETGLLCSKDISMSLDNGLQAIYDSFKKGIIPESHNFKLLLDGYIQQLQENYVKMKLIFEGIQKQYPNQRHEQLQHKIELYKIPVLFKKNPKFAIHSLSKQKNNPSKVREKKQQQLLEILSPEETIQKFQKIINKIIKSSKIINMLRTNILIHKFAKQILCFNK